MTLAELLTLVDKTLDEATGAAAVVQLKEEITTLSAANDSLTEANQTLQQTNSALRDTNAQLAIRVTAPITKPQNDPEEPPTPEEAFDSLVNQIKGE